MASVAAGVVRLKTTISSDQMKRRLYITMTSQRASWILKSPAIRRFIQPFGEDNITENIAAHVTGTLWGEFTGHQWIPLTKGQ